MTVSLNHTIVAVRDKRAAAEFYVHMLDLAAPVPVGPFLAVELANGVSLDFADDHEPAPPQHYAFLVDEPDFDAILGRIRAAGLPFYADPAGKRAGEFNTNDGGRGLYWADPDGNWLEIITRPYGG